MTRKRKLLVLSALLCVAAIGGFSWWRHGAPFQAPFLSPNGRFHIQKYSTFTPRFLAMPGQGSDSIGGYIRLYDKSGKLIHERRQSFIRDIEPIWAGDKVYLKGVAEMDSHPWLLPESSE